MTLQFPRVVLETLGGQRLLVDGTAVAGPGYRKGWALLAYLVLEPGLHARDKLAELLGIDSPGHLRQLLSRLRAALTLPDAPPALHTERTLIGLNPDYPLACDAWHFLGQGSSVLPLTEQENRLALYGGEFLHGLTLPESPDFEAWLAVRREQLRQHAVGLLLTLRQAREVSGRMGEALALARRLVELDPWNEAAHRDLMRLLDANGQTAAALAHYAVCERTLQAALGIVPGAATQALYQRLRDRHGPVGRSLGLPAALPQLGEKRLVTVLCLELEPLGGEPGSPVQDMQLEMQLERLAASRQPFREDCREVLQAAGAHASPELGGRWLAYFGYPVARENAARQAVRTALEVLALAERHGLTVRLGLHTGLVLLDGVSTAASAAHATHAGPSPDSAGLTSGRAVQLAALARPGSCYLSPATAMLVRGYFTLEAAPGYGGEAVWQVLAATGKAHRLDALGSLSALPPLIGRDVELQRLLAQWQALLAAPVEAAHALNAPGGRAPQTAPPAACLIEGEAGIGKSRLLRSLSEQVAQLSPGGGRVLTLYCLPEFTQTPFQPLLTLFAGLAGLHCERGGASSDGGPPAAAAGAEGDARRLARLRLWLYNSLPPGRRHGDTALALLADALGLPLLGLGESLVALAPPRRKELLAALLHDLLLGLGGGEPLLLLVEDLHWCDPSLLDLLIEHARQSTAAAGPSTRPPLPLLTVLTTRPHCAAAQRLEQFAPRLVLAPLAAAEVGQLVQAIAGELPPPVVQRIVAVAEGVPLFVEEMARMAQSVSADGRQGEAMLGREQGAPLSLQELLAARLDSCGEARGSAQLAACIGRDFAWELLQQLSPLPVSALEQQLAALEAAGLVRSSGPGRYQFRHVLIQEAAYASLPLSGRRAAHRQLATILEQGEGLPEIVAHHLAAAGDAAAAMPRWRAAGQNAARQSAFREAESLYQRGLELAPEALAQAGGAASHALLLEEFYLQAALGSVRLALYGYGSAAAREAFGRAMALSDQLSEQPSDPLSRKLSSEAQSALTAALFPVMFGLWHGGGYEASTVAPLDLAERLARLAAVSGDPAQQLVADYAFSHNYFWLARYAEARRHQEAAVSNPHGVSSETLIALCGEDSALLSASFLAWTLCFQGCPNRAQVVMVEAVAAARQGGHVHTLCFVLIFAGVLMRHLLKPEETLALAREVAELAETHSLSLWQAAANALTGWALGMLDDPEGVIFMRRGVEQCQGAMRLVESTFRSYLVEVLYRQGHFAAVIDEADAALAVARACSDAYLLPEFHRLRAGALLALAPQELPAVREELLAALDLSREQGSCWLELRLLTDLLALPGQPVPARQCWALALQGLVREINAESIGNSLLADLQRSQRGLDSAREALGRDWPELAHPEAVGSGEGRPVRGEGQAPGSAAKPVSTGRTRRSSRSAKGGGGAGTG